MAVGFEEEDVGEEVSKVIENDKSKKKIDVNYVKYNQDSKDENDLVVQKS
jgi:hypothetical protein